MSIIEILLTVTFVVYVSGLITILITDKKYANASLSIFGSLGAISLCLLGAYSLFSEGCYHKSLWVVPNIGALSITIDNLSALFLLIAGFIFVVVSIFSARYMQHYIGRLSTKGFAFSYLLLLTSISAILISSDIFLFLITWEAMSLLCYVLVNSEYERSEARRASYLMLAVGEAGTVAIAIAFIILANAAGSTSFSAIKLASANLSHSLHWTVFLLTFLGFSTKIGLVPVNFWLPRAHPVAPANISALLSGLILNLGIYGILRVIFNILNITFVGEGIVVLMIGAISALVGILYATIENDMKRLLAHSSIENMGIICTGLGASLIFYSTKHPVFASIALIAALYHMINHSVYKSLLFMGAGIVDTSTGSRNLDDLGGLIKKMPWTAFFVLIGSLAISAMPPFNGFVSEWLTLESLLRSVELSSWAVKIAFVLSGVMLALTAGLAVTCFVRFFAMGFLGISRSQAAEKTTETTKSALLPMAVLAVVCLILGILPSYVIPTLDKIAIPLTKASASKALIPNLFMFRMTEDDKLPKPFVDDFHNIGGQIGKDIIPARGLAIIHRGGKENPVVFAMSTSYMIIMLIGLLAICAITVWLLAARRRKVSYAPRWDGGVNELLPEMTYTATGFAQPVRVIFSAILRPRVTDRREVIAEHFRMSIRRKQKEVHMVDRLILYPLANFAQLVSSILARMHSGRINAYAAYVLLTLIIFLIIASVL